MGRLTETPWKPGIAWKPGTAWRPDNAPRRLVDLLHVETGHRIGFLDDPGGGGARLAGELLSRQVGLFLYGVVVREDLASPRYDDECFDLIISASGRRSWPAVSRALSEMHRLVRPGGTVAVTSPHPLTPIGRGLRRVPRPDLARLRWGPVGTTADLHRPLGVEDDPASVRDARDAHDIAVGHRLVDVFGSAVRTELTSRVVWRATRRA